MICEDNGSCGFGVVCDFASLKYEGAAAPAHAWQRATSGSLGTPRSGLRVGRIDPVTSFPCAPLAP